MILPIFPEGGLTSSVVTTVWVGVFVIVFFNLRFGWVLSGLVVPGYIVPLVILRPVAASVIVIEAVLTYALVWFFSEKLSRGRFGRYSALFGRDRFLGLVLASVAVRVTLDGWLLPIGADWLSENFNRQLDWQSNLQSFGLVVVSLMANQFWKPGLVRGLLSLAVVTFLCWFIVRYGLMEFTNFRLSGVTYIYEGLASSILASPKAYIILVITAMIASQMNLRYGWDFSGILIPALIALQWYQPTKILSSFVEAMVIYILARLILKLPMLAGTTIEGGRKLVLFFNISFAYKLVLGHILVWLALDVKTTDFYGFGYLLSTLLAIKAHDKDIFPRLMRSTFEVSLAGAVLGNIIGFVLAWIVPTQLSATNATNIAGRKTGNTENRLFSAAVGDAWLRKYGPPQPGYTRREREALEAAIALLDSGAEPRFIAPGLAAEGLLLYQGSDDVVAISRPKGDGRDLILFNPLVSGNLAVVLEDAAAQPGIAAAGLSLFRSQKARWLIVTAPSKTTDVADKSLLAIFRTLHSIPELRIQSGDKARLGLEGNIAALLDINGLRRALPDLQTRFSDRADNAMDTATLFLNKQDIARFSDMDIKGDNGVPACDLSVKTSTIRPQADLAEMAYWRFEIAEPMGNALISKQPVPLNTGKAASLLGLSLDRCMLKDKVHYRLGSQTGNFGTMLFNPNADSTKMVQSSGDNAVLLETAQTISQTWGAGTLLLALDDQQLSLGQRNLFGVVSQAMIRATDDQPGGVLQVRAPFGTAPLLPGNPEIVITPDYIEESSEWQNELQSLAARTGFSAQLSDRRQGMAGYEISPNLAFRYLRQSRAKRYATFWVTAEANTRTGAKP
jgi:Capsule biosynthesis CapC